MRIPAHGDELPALMGDAILHSPDDLLRAVEDRMGSLPPHLRAALLAADRAAFVRPVDREYAYENVPLPLDTHQGSVAPPVGELLSRYGSWKDAIFAPEFRAAGATISQPLMYMLAFQLLDLGAGDRFLEVGTGTGYGAALAAQVVGDHGQVTSVAVDPRLVSTARENASGRRAITVLHDDGLARKDLLAAHNRCWVTFSVLELPAEYIDELREGATLLAPVGPPPPAQQRYLRIRRENGRIVEDNLGIPVSFVPSRPLIRG